MAKGQIRVEYDADGNVTKRFGIFELPDKSKLRGGWFMAMQDGLDWLSTQNFTGETLKVLIHIWSKLDFENYILVKQADIATKLKMPKQNVSRAIKVLIDAGVIHAGPNVGQVKTYRLDPSFGFKGKAKNMGKLLELVHGADGRKRPTRDDKPTE